MNNRKPQANPYHKYYVDLRLEREGLFRLIQKQFHPIEVLYPGCSTHLTPAFFFPHVVFVDRDSTAQAFFSDQAAILDLVKRHKRYRRAPYVQFIFQDFTQPLPLPPRQFDLLLALFTGGVAKACKNYLRTDGWLLTNNHHQDAVDAAQDPGYRLSAVVEMHQGKYQAREAETGDLFELAKEPGGTIRYLKQTSDGIKYIENVTYYLFERVLAGKKSDIKTEIGGKIPIKQSGSQKNQL
jgi:hypothetical protein